MKHEKLFLMLKGQAENLRVFLEIIKLQQESLVNNNSENLDVSVSNEEQLFLEINQLQKSIIKEIKRIDADEQLELREYKLSELVRVFARTSEPDLKKIIAVRKKITEYIKEISRLNFQNSYLIDHSRQLIREVITRAAKDKNVIFDRRV
ncbi:MAG: flagellar export chaperone FlgN [Ignavibacteriaceae bacterium]